MWSDYWITNFLSEFNKKHGSTMDPQLLLNKMTIGKISDYDGMAYYTDEAFVEVLGLGFLKLMKEEYAAQGYGVLYEA
jgi:hypothetical protein